MNQDTNRLLMELERNMRAVNREIINPKSTELTVGGLRPVLRLVAHARARYLRALLDLGARVDDEAPSDEDFSILRQLRTQYEEVVNAARELETAIQRGYLDVDVPNQG